jgi:hypothetical protein
MQEEAIALQSRSNRPVRFGFLTLALVTASSPIHAQDVSTTMYLSAGPERNGISATAGFRLEVGTVWGAYARAALRGVTNVCLTSIPPHCNYPQGDTHEYAVGLARIYEQGAWRGFVGAGGGVLSWQDELDPFIDFTADIRRAIIGRISVLIGTQAVLAPEVEREPRGNDAIVSSKSVFFPSVMLGVSFVIW